MFIKNKVLAYIFRYKNEVKEVLVFDHREFPEVNPQVPAGTVEQGEDFISAICREVLEESGLEMNEDPMFLGVFDYLRSDVNELHKRHVYSFEVNITRDCWEHVVTDGEEDKGLVFDFYWLPVGLARDRLVARMGEYL